MAMNKNSTPQWQKSLALGQPSAPMVNQPTPEWHPATPTPTAMQSKPIAPIPMPKWSHFLSSPPTDNKTWPANLIEIIRAIKQAPHQCPTLPEFTFDISSEAAKKNYLTLRRKYKEASQLCWRRNATQPWDMAWNFGTSTPSQKSSGNTQIGSGCLIF
jgi:hypothetical protein